MKQTILKLLENYRRFLFACHGYTSNGVMPKGVPCNVEDPTIETTHGDVVHPCVRYIEEGFEGHQWWMVYTPYYAGNDKLENPRLCYADALQGEPPIEWKFYCSIANTPDTGYNSDPTLFFIDGKLYVFWRECLTLRAKELGCSMLTVGCRVHENQVTYMNEPILMESSTLTDKEVCPTFITNGEGYKAYSIHMGWNPDFIYRIPPKIGSVFFKYRILNILDALGLCNLTKSFGVAVWSSSSLEHAFRYLRTVQFGNMSKLYQPWHMDLFKSSLVEESTIYAVVQSRQRHARICLAKSLDGEQFCFFHKPLLTSKNIGMIGLYKPTALQVGSNLYLYYTVIDNKDDNLHRLFVSSINWKDLLCKISE